MNSPSPVSQKLCTFALSAATVPLLPSLLKSQVPDVLKLLLSLFKKPTLVFRFSLEYNWSGLQSTLRTVANLHFLIQNLCADALFLLSLVSCLRAQSFPAFQSWSSCKANLRQGNKCSFTLRWPPRLPSPRWGYSTCPTGSAASALEIWIEFGLKRLITWLICQIIGFS